MRDRYTGEIIEPGVSAAEEVNVSKPKANKVNKAVNVNRKKVPEVNKVDSVMDRATAFGRLRAALAADRITGLDAHAVRALLPATSDERRAYMREYMRKWRSK